jgi:hypothetical protein
MILKKGVKEGVGNWNRVGVTVKVLRGVGVKVGVAVLRWPGACAARKNPRQ